jgi:hypothetical protein
MEPKQTAAETWVGLLLPATSWVAHHLSRYLLVRFTSSHGMRWPLHLSTGTCLAGVALGAWFCARRLWQERARAAATSKEDRFVPDGESTEGDGDGDTPERSRGVTLAGWGLALAAYFFLLILAQAYPVFVLSPQEITDHPMKLRPGPFDA